MLLRQRLLVAMFFQKNRKKHISTDVYKRQCIHCHSREGLNVFSARRGGVFCDNCGTQVQGRHILSDTLYTMQYIVSADITKLYTFAVSDDVLEELRSIMTVSYTHLDVYKRQTWSLVTRCLLWQEQEQE